MFPEAMSNSASPFSDEVSISSGPSRVHQEPSTFTDPMDQTSMPSDDQPQKPKKKRTPAGNPDPDAEVIALSPKTLMSTNRFVCEVCNKGFQRDQNLQLHRRGHNLPWKLKQRIGNEVRKRAYVCPEPTCIHHHPSRALGDLTGIKKHYCRKHGEKKWKCEKCTKMYAVLADWKAHSKTCGSREHRCDCGTIFSRKDSFITHKAFCDALAQETLRISANPTNSSLTFPSMITQNTDTDNNQSPFQFSHFSPSHHQLFFPNPWEPLSQNPNPNSDSEMLHHMIKHDHQLYQTPQFVSSPFGNNHAGSSTMPPPLSATGLLQEAANVGAVAGEVGSTMAHLDMHTWQPTKGKHTHDFMGLTDQFSGSEVVDHGGEALPFTGGVDYQPFHDGDQPFHDGDPSMLKPHEEFDFADEPCSQEWGDC